MKKRNGRRKIRIGIIGFGNCASALLQAIHWYGRRNSLTTGIMQWDIGGYRPGDIEPVLVYDIDKRKVGKPLHEAILAKPNNTKIFQELPPSKVKVKMGKVLDGVAAHMEEYPEDQRFVLSNTQELRALDFVLDVKDAKPDMMLCYLPVGSENAVRFYAEQCLAAKVSFVNCMPVFIASDPEWAERFRKARLLVVGDDVKAQLGATILHRALMTLFKDRGVGVTESYQINVGGNTDFLNMLDRKRLKSKKVSKTDAVQKCGGQKLETHNLHVGPSDYIPWMRDNKVCFLRMQGLLCGGVPMDLEVRLSVEDSPNSAGVAIDVIRYSKVAIERRLTGAVNEICAYFMKHPPLQIPDAEALRLLRENWS